MVPLNTVEQSPSNIFEQSLPNTIEAINEGVFKHSKTYIEDGDEVQVTRGSQIQNLKGFKALKAGGAGNFLSLKKLREHYAYKLEKDLSDDDDVGYFGIYQRKQACVNEDGDTPVDYYEAGGEQYHASLNEHVTLSPNAHDTMPTRDESCGLDQQIKVLNDELQKLKEDKDEDSEANIKLVQALKEKFKDNESLKVVNALLMEQIDLQLAPATPLAILQSHQPMTEINLAKKYDDLLSAHEELKKKLIAKEDFILNWTSKYKEEVVRVTEETNDLEVWRQLLKKALESEGMGDMGDPMFEELFDHNERFFTIAQQGPKVDYQEDLVSTGLTIENIFITKRENMAKKKKLQEVLFQSWMKYLLDVHSVKISDSNSVFRVLATILHQNQHKFLDVMKSLNSFPYKDPAFWKSIFSQIMGIQFTPAGEKAYKSLL
ncbi:hypothetical protein GIB67_007965 [Kingdonia uniflora]|uniref:Uncharacterized protein n=1 Tax=Kingdonia uniflora TaxID=39325 RepID=A0A7J7LTE1_9MAGN|nr:hypothetical protein GIB67_007965 [Kingdonia uniflora]